MASLARCSSCRGFLPASAGSCPHCGVSAPAGVADRIGFWLKAAGGASVAMTLMACYGVPVDPYDPTDTDPTEGTGETSGDTEPASGSGSTSAAEASTGAAESSTGAAESSTGAGSDGSTGAGGEPTPTPSR